MNNFEKIKNMTLDELAEFFFATKNSCNSCVAKSFECNQHPQCKQDIKKWLQQEVSE